MPKLASIVTHFEETVSRFSKSCALRWNGGSWSYGELNARANRLAHFLIGAGVQPETPVGVFALRSPETLTAFLAILKAGGAYVPLDPSYPEDRIRYYLKDAGIQLVLADPKESFRLTSMGAKIVLLDEGLAQDQPETDPGIETGPDSLAHILFTSGSTGRPKGVLIEHRGIIRLTKNSDFIEIRPQDVFLQYAPLSFDVTTFEIWGALLNGATLAIPPAEHRSLHDLASALRDFEVTTLWLTAGLFQAVVELELESLAGIKQLLTGGDVVSPSHAERFLQKYPGCRLINGYGPTENTVFTSCHHIQLENPMPARLSIGRPIQKTGVLILDERLQAVPNGEWGEIVATGEGVARGYLNQPQLTERSFIQVIDASGQKVRGYRTGDQGRYHANGTLDFRGRMDDQVKINGLRIEPGEIKSLLQSHPEIAGAEVLVAEREGKKQLEACIVRRSGTDMDESAVRTFLGQRIPGNWLPSSISFLPRLPLNPNGKVDRRALLENVPATPETGDPGLNDEPEDFLEKAIWSLWREMLPGRRIGRHDHFFDLGGDSLSAINMIAQVEKMIRRPVGLRSLLEGGTIVDIAAAARATSPVLPPPLLTCTQAGKGKPPFFFAHGDYVRAGLYCQRIVQRLDPDQPFYALAPPGTFGGDLLSTIEEIAARFTELIRSVQPKGPYYLGGFCNGAVAIYEVARQLIRAGETVSALVLVDPPDLYLFFVRRKVAKMGKFLGLSEHQGRAVFQRIAEGIEIWRDQGPLHLVSEFWTRLGSWTLKNLKSVFDFNGAAPTSSMPNLNFHYYEVLARYEPQGYPESRSVTVILRQGDSLRRSRQTGYWSEFIPEASFEAVPGTHMELAKNIGAITDIIKIALSNGSASKEKDACAERISISKNGPSASDTIVPLTTSTGIIR
ncbi:MAG: amino acid adenylation domain-containing protein [Methylacidiphilales bacterium]|nr:amino acid adenylation domain-containing protein [Candidatus Methylacidiphilales bacterium]